MISSNNYNSSSPWLAITENFNSANNYNITISESSNKSNPKAVYFIYSEYTQQLIDVLTPIKSDSPLISLFTEDVEIDDLREWTVTMKLNDINFKLDNYISNSNSTKINKKHFLTYIRPQISSLINILNASILTCRRMISEPNDCYIEV